MPSASDQSLTALAKAHHTTDTVRRRHLETQRPKVLVLHPAMAPYRVDLFNELSRAVELRVLFLNDHLPYDPHLDGNESAAALTCDYGVLPRKVTARARMLFRELVKVGKPTFWPDAVVTHEFGWASWIVSLLRQLGCNLRHIVWTTRNPSQLKVLSGVRLLAARRLVAQADAVLVYSDAARQQLTAISGARSEGIFVCANHQSRERLRDLARSGAEAVSRKCQALGIANSRLVVSVGRCVPSKGIANAIEAFVTAFGQRSDVAFVAVGEGPMRRGLQEIADRSAAKGRIFLVGHARAAETQAWLAAASLNVLASSSEPFGAVVGEGLAHGTPCICSAGAGAAASIVRPDCGAVFPSGEVSLLASLMESRLASSSAPAVVRLFEERCDLRPTVVEDDVKGFRAAVRFALSER